MVHIYYKKLDCDCSDEQSLAMYKVLPKQRQEQIKKLNNEKKKLKNILTGFFLQQVLSFETGLPVVQLYYCYGQNGKPELDYEKIKQQTKQAYKRIHFNMSHSGDYVVIAVSEELVGIDIEHKTRNCLNVAKRCFTKEEYQWIVGFENEKDRQHAFLDIWTKKEAYIKYTGLGLRCPLNHFNVLNELKDGKDILTLQNVDMLPYGMDAEYTVSLCAIKTQYLVKNLKEQRI